MELCRQCRHGNICTAQNPTITDCSAFKTRGNDKTGYRCPFCGGRLSEIREYNGRHYRYCYGCFHEYYRFEEESNGT